MTSPNGDERLEIILDECLAEIESGRSTIADCVARYPDMAAEIEPLLRVGAVLYEVKIAPLPARDVRAIRGRVLGRVAECRSPREASPRTGMWRLLWASTQPTRVGGLAIALVVVLLVGTLGTYQVAASSLPGDSLYSMKLASESLALTLAPNAAAQAVLHASFAARRVDEAVQGRQRGSQWQAAALQTATQELDRADIALRQAESAGQSIPWERIAGAIDSGEQKLASAAPSDLPALNAMAVFHNARQQALEKTHRKDAPADGSAAPIQNATAAPTPIPTAITQPTPESTDVTPSAEDQATPRPSNSGGKTPSTESGQEQAPGQLKKATEAASTDVPAAGSTAAPSDNKPVVPAATRKAAGKVVSTPSAPTASAASPQPQGTSVSSPTQPDSTSQPGSPSTSNSQGNGNSGGSGGNSGGGGGNSGGGGGGGKSGGGGGGGKSGGGGGRNK
jgi:uncharacterized membrane protein YgcG